MIIDAKRLGFAELNEKIRKTDGDCRIVGCLGQRFIASGMGGKSIDIDGVPAHISAAPKSPSTVMRRTLSAIL